MSKAASTRAKKALQQPREVTFTYQSEFGAKAVYLAGSFNEWDAEADQMRGRNGKFTKKMQLLPGEYQYKFVVDGEWQVDPEATAQVPNEVGSMNSVIRISAPEASATSQPRKGNSTLSGKPDSRTSSRQDRKGHKR